MYWISGVLASSLTLKYVHYKLTYSFIHVYYIFFSNSQTHI